MQVGKDRNNGKQSLIIYGLAMVAACCLIGCIGLIKVEDVQSWYALLASQIIAFLLAGTISVRVFERKLFSRAFTSATSLRTMLFVAVVVTVILAFLYNAFNAKLVPLSFSGAAAFVIPYLTIYALRIFEAIAPKQADLWFKRDNLIDYKSFVFLASTSLKIKLRSQILDNKYTVYSTVVPTQMEFGKMFHYFLIQQQNDDNIIETKDEFNRQVGWRFFVEKYWGFYLKPIDPGLNIWENQVKSNSTILAKRVMLPPVKQSYQFQREKSHELHRY